MSFFNFVVFLILWSPTFTSGRDVMNNSVGMAFFDDEWGELLGLLASRIADESLGDRIFFHGTSDFLLDDIQIDGLVPDDVSQALLEGDKDKGVYGTFWGSLGTANAYAVDTSLERHPGSRPVLFASTIASRLEDSIIVPDGATLDFPLDGLTKLGDDQILDKWTDANCDLDWGDALHDLGAVICIHDFTIPAEEMCLIRSANDVELFISKIRSADNSIYAPSLL